MKIENGLNGRRLILNPGWRQEMLGGNVGGAGVGGRD
jgi:hypothetical protein